MKTVDYELKESIQYAGKTGEMETAQFISISPPTGRNINEVAAIQSEIMKAIQWAQSQNDVEAEPSGGDANEITGEVIMTTLQMAPGVDVAKVLLCIKEILTLKGMAEVDGDSRFTKPLYDSLSIPDIYGLSGEFLANFITPSL